ncbi:RNA polymerase sigma-70 factor, ECF subfamily [Streptomyces sp. LcepLS]|nr:RNA polymerase sigma-70 factor, ECF subfamily [Streptomyces sp. LcepLS]
MPRPLREAIDQAYAHRRDYRQTAADLGITEEEARRRLRLGLQLLSTAHDHPVPGAGEPSP